MRRKFAVLIVMAAVAALAAPASSLAAAKMYPAGSSFEINGGSGAYAPTLTTSLGSCTLSKISGQIPAAPNNETTGYIAIPAPTVGSCTSGLTLRTSGSWLVGTEAGHLSLVVGFGGLEIKQLSNPGCALIPSSSAILGGDWVNGTTGTGGVGSSTYHPNGAFNLRWSGPSCGTKTGTSEAVTYKGLINLPVKNLTTPALPITIG